MKLAVISTVFVVSLCDAVQKQDLGEDSEQVVSINEGEMGVEHYAFLEFVESASNGLDNVILYDAGLKGFTHKITIGKPDQKFVVHVTTYSSMLWIPHVNCTINRNKFNPSKSTTFMKRNQTWTLSSGTSGLLGSDNVKIGGGDEVQIVVDNSVFGMATKISSGSLEVVDPKSIKTEHLL
ncbi:hypothetical protein OESDEN_06092 [Oesophagostomum dentatum]|uniref:Peptidase A1 domain-containing protein n=1 Tax=Oesophagostomum dentatum TaxID=61180 RepID=A0A0B1T8S8_OESDE|nr:hypothetical protein OESDEN_06092 [Oesophagostomum dentatum]